MNKTPKVLMKASIVVSVLVLLNGCAQPQDKTLSIEKEIASVAQNAKPAPVKVPDAVTADLTKMPASQAPAPERFNVAVNNVPARAFFLSLVNGTNINIVVHPDVTGNITLNLKNVTVKDVLDVTRDIYGYDYREKNHIYTVYPDKMRTEVFHVNYLDVQRVGVSDTSVNIGQSNSSDNNNTGYAGSQNHSNGSDNNSASLLAMLKDNDVENAKPLSPGSRVQTLSRTDFWASLQKTVSAIVGGNTGKRMVMVSPQAGMIVVKALPNELSSVRRFLERSALSVKRQVILEAKILEVQLNKNYNTGINWAQISGQLNYNYQHQYDNTQSLNIPDQAAKSVLDASSNVFTSILQVPDITKLVSLLKTQGNVQVLSSPRVSTVNNQKAVIRVGSDEYFITGISNNTTSNASSVTSTPNIELSSFFSGISLDVTPQISASDHVILHIHPVVSDVTDQQKDFTVGDKDFSLPLALRGVRESDSIVRAKSGQVIVLGGLMQEKSANQNGKKPGLGDIPLLGKLFSSASQRSNKTELVILLKPVVVKGDAWQDQIEDAVDNIDNIGDAHRKMLKNP